MIVISGALVLVAAVLLVIGVAGAGLGMVYASIAVSLLAFATLTLGVLQRRGSGVPAAAEDADDGAASAGPGRQRSAGGSGAVALAGDQQRAGGGVAVAERGADDRDGDLDLDSAEHATSYRRTGTEQDTTPEPVPAVRAPTADRRPFDDAADETAAVGRAPVGSAAVDEAPYDDAPYDDALYDDLEYGGTVLVVPGRPRYHVDGCRYLVGKDLEEVDVLDAREEGFTACGVCKPDQVLEEEMADEQRRLDADEREARDDASPTVVQRPAGPSAAGVARAAASLQVEPGNVVVIPDRGKYHRGDCRYVRDAPGRQQVPRATATRQGYGACGICRP